MQAGRQNGILALMNQEPTGLLGISNYSHNLTSSDFDYYIACSSINQRRKEWRNLSLRKQLMQYFAVMMQTLMRYKS